MKKSSNLPVLFTLIALAGAGILALISMTVPRRHTAPTAPHAAQTPVTSLPDEPAAHNTPAAAADDLISQIDNPQTRRQLQIVSQQTLFGSAIASAMAQQALERQNNPPVWQEVECTRLPLSQKTEEPLVCRQSQYDWCAFFKNGRPFFCQNNQGTLRYAANKWGSSQMVVQFDQEGILQNESYYENGRLTSSKENSSGVISQIWWEPNLRLYQTDARTGRVLNKFYFNEAKPYVHYPDGNDMGERNGPWEIKDRQIFMDGKPFYTLPEKTPLPDYCAMFQGVCTAQAPQ